MNKTYAGIVGSPVTPFKTDCTIDFDTFEKQVDFLIASGANVLVHPMHIGECTSLTDDERRQLARALVSAADGRVPTFVNVSYAGTELSVAMAGHSAGAGATGVVLMPPDHCSSGPEAIVEHFRAVAGAGSGKMIAYNNPQAAGVELSLAILERLFEHIPGVAGIKDASLNMET
ncbi:MAG TPA: dihydrodipicolinate synthase family protein, partial [Burkholderiales bacterium]|nr:dihydrodipicolinate synthase family protein [Burkholderiales bacterium]